MSRAVRVTSVLGLLGLFGLAASCGSSSSATPDAAPTADAAIAQACIDAESHSDLTWIQANIFDKQCQFSGCHGTDSGGTSGRQSLMTAADTIASLVNQKSNLETSETLVIPGSSATSYTMVMLGSIAGTIPPKDAAGDDVGTMPLNTGGALLCQQKRDAIARWIDAGATND